MGALTNRNWILQSPVYTLSQPVSVQFEKGWLVSNTGTKKWKHVSLVHVEGFKPVSWKVDVPEIKPGECVELVARYPPITQEDPDVISR